MEILFLIDMVVGFLTGYVDIIVGEEITKPSLIAYHYIFNGGFIVDFLSLVEIWLIPFQGLQDMDGGGGIVIRLFRLFKIVRVRRLNKLVQIIHIDKHSKNRLKILIIIFELFLICHIQGCFLYLSVLQQEIWVPNLDFGYIQEYNYDVFKREFVFVYWKMMYH